MKRSGYFALRFINHIPDNTTVVVEKTQQQSKEVCGKMVTNWFSRCRINCATVDFRKIPLRIVSDESWGVFSRQGFDMTGLKAFLVVFLLMPLGHALMIGMNLMLGQYLAWGAFALGLVGLGLLVITRFTASTSWQSFLGAFAGVLLWTATVEYGLYFGARTLGIPKVNGTAGEYRMMEFTWGFLVLLLLYLVFHEGVRCNLFVWLRRTLHLSRGSVVSGKVSNYGPRTAFEMIGSLWFFYVLLLLLYDKSVFGERHPATYACLLFSFAGGMWLLYRLWHIKNMGYAIRYAIPTVIVLWNVVEILARWKVFTEPWIKINYPVMAVIAAAFLIGVVVIVRDIRRRPSSQL